MGNWHPGMAAAQGQPERLLRPHQVARILGVTAQQVRKLWRQGKLGGEKLSERNLKIPESAIRDYLRDINQE
jgi:excisionase family DNA binding protein